MSIRAAEYALDCLQRDRRLNSTARAVFLALAHRANHHTGMTYTGGWLVDAIGGHFVTVRRALHQVADEGYIQLEHRAGQASIVRFPIASALSTTPRTNALGQLVHTPRGAARPPRAVPRDVHELVHESQNSLTSDGVACACEGTTWIYDEIEHRQYPCPSCAPRARARRAYG